MRLIDCLRHRDWVPVTPPEARGDPRDWGPYVRRIMEQLVSVPVFEISNVASYFYRESPREIWDIFADFPRPMPPFTWCWFEWNVPSETYNGKSRERLALHGIATRAGCAVVCEMAPGGRVEDTKAKYRMNVLPFLETRHRGDLLIMAATCFGLSEEFEVVGSRPGNVMYAFPLSDRDVVQDTEKMIELGKQSLTVAYPCMLAISMLNCRNVVPRIVKTPEALIRKHSRHGRDVRTQHYVIEIQPICAEIKRQTGTAGYGKRAPAIIRGHFKDYTHGNGLFGKLTGMYWWNQRMDGIKKPEYRLKSAVGALDPQWRKQ